MPLSSEVLREINMLVRGGFEPEDRIVDILTEEMYQPGELDTEEVESAITVAVKKHAREKRSWPDVTDCDRLDAVFLALAAQHVVALQYAGYTQSDGYEDVSEGYHRRPDKDKVVGYCFYHAQDLERAVNGDGLYLAFGPIDPKNEETEGPAVGALIVNELRGAGFEPMERNVQSADNCPQDRLEARVSRRPNPSIERTLSGLRPPSASHVKR